MCSCSFSVQRTSRLLVIIIASVLNSERSLIPFSGPSTKNAVESASRVMASGPTRVTDERPL